MGAIASASTVYARAYLTEVGRKYLFQDNNNPRFVELPDGTKIDRLKIERFSLGDPDVNYKIPNLLESGDIPDLSGENENNITGAKGRNLTHLISPSDSTLGDGTDTLEYMTSQGDIIIDLNKDLSKIPTVFTQELITLLNDEPTIDGSYNVLPKNLGENKLKNNELVVVLSSPKDNNPGYRMRVFYPTIENNLNKITVQFEKSTKTTSTYKSYQKSNEQPFQADVNNSLFTSFTNGSETIQ
jgi:hypothetical protein